MGTLSVLRHNLYIDNSDKTFLFYERKFIVQTARAPGVRLQISARFFGNSAHASILHLGPTIFPFVWIEWKRGAARRLVEMRVISKLAISLVRAVRGRGSKNRALFDPPTPPRSASPSLASLTWLRWSSRKRDRSIRMSSRGRLS